MGCEKGADFAAAADDDGSGVFVVVCVAVGCDEVGFVVCAGVVVSGDDGDSVVDDGDGCSHGDGGISDDSSTDGMMRKTFTKKS